MVRTSLASIAAAFAQELSELLNGTVTSGAYVGVIQRPDGFVVLGTGLRTLGRAQPVWLSTRGDVPCWLTLFARTSLDASGYLVVEDSTYVLSVGENPIEVLHFDYERDKIGHPDAHLQINATSPAWEALLTASGKAPGSLGKLHLPVGGRRFRPSVEDILEMLILEGIVEPASPWWRDQLTKGRDAFQRRQLRAGIRRDPLAAVLELEKAGYKVIEPHQVTTQVVQIDDARKKRNRQRKKR